MFSYYKKQFFITLILPVLFNLIFADPTDGCELSSNEVFLTSTGDVLYNVPDDDIGGFQFNVDGATFLSASGGDAQTAGFVIQGGGSTVLAFSFTGSVVPAGCGTLTLLTLSGNPSGLSGIVVSDPNGTELDFEYYAGPVLGCMDETACNYNSAANYDDGSCEYDDGITNCDGDCYNDEDQDDVCDENDDCVGLLDVCGVCDGLATNLSQCLEFYKSKRPVKTPSAEQVRQPIYKSGLDYWKNFETDLDSLQKLFSTEILND